MEDIQFNKESAYILGAGGFARELKSWANDTDEFLRIYNLKGFLDDNLDSLDKFDYDLKVVDVINESSITMAKNLIMGIANSLVKEKLHNIILSQQSINLVSFKHRFSLIGENSKIGVGLVLCPFSIISCDCNIGDLVTINSGSQIGHDVSVGNYTSIMANVDIGGGANIGNHVFVGSNAVILPGVKVPDFCRIGAGSVVLRSIKVPGTYFGNPAKRIV